MSEPFLSAKNAGKTYMLGKRALEVLRGIDLEVNRGDFLALRGASGAGKSTLLHLLGGLDFPDPGEIQSRGRSLRDLPRRDLAQWRNREVGFIFQAYYLLPELDALENVCLPARMARTPATEAANRGRELLTRVGLQERMEHKPYELSGGEQQRVAIARALINQPDLILADEPTGNLDSHTGQEIIDLLCSLREERQMTLVMATHDPNVAARAARTIHLVDGKIVNS
ncbi:MAG TPA: ABC transporter ATP-binding protein [Verrucomicrobiae bacterium]|jgi:ABC-type lipoprotein export system ATPase subunit|nr:ABC transporter ATP-binding protein [Verrucomicrobiae bacterium]